MIRAYQTCIEMFEQRDYNIIEKTDDQILAIKKNKKRVCAFMSNTPKFNVERIQEFISVMRKIDVWHAVIIFKDNATPVAKKIIEESNELIIELFQENEMQYNITNHYLVPKHEIMYEKGTKESKEFKLKYGDKFPIILKADPISRFYGYAKGDIIKITRKGGHVMYRIVK